MAWRDDSPIPGGVLWELRYKGPRSIIITRIRTLTANVLEAEELGRHIVSRQTGPSYRYISVVPFCEGTTEEMLKDTGEVWPAKKSSTAADKGASSAKADDAPSRGSAASGRIGA